MIACLIKINENDQQGAFKAVKATWGLMWLHETWDVNVWSMLWHNHFAHANVDSFLKEFKDKYLKRTAAKKKKLTSGHIDFNTVDFAGMKAELTAYCIKPKL